MRILWHRTSNENFSLSLTKRQRERVRSRQLPLLKSDGEDTGPLAFFVLAAQIYGSKLLGRKIVSSGIYRYIRHPQYLSLGLSAFGLSTMWPRMIIFLFFVGMLFAYYFLARVEERRMLAIDPSYADYMRHTGMFLPGNPGGRLFRLLFGNLREQKFARPLALTSLFVLAMLVGF